MKNPLIPMGAITGNPTKNQINEMIQSYVRQGIQQFLIYPRSGCEVEYMSDRWLEVCRDIIEAAKRERMDIWLYDEFNWPSGSCGGKVMEENPEFYASSVYVDDGKCSVKKYEKYADILNPDAVDCFIENTHEMYYKHFGRYFGDVIKGIFTDEPDLSVCTWNGGKYPYTKNLDIIYRQKFGRDLFEDMAQERPSEQFKRDFWGLLTEMYRNNFVDKLNDWCLSHDIVLTGHTNKEHIIESGVKTCGNTIRALRGFSLPAIDEIRTYTSIDTAEWLTFGCAEAAVRGKENGGLAELFALGPTYMVPARIEQMLWLVAMFKIDHYVLAVAAFDARGNYEKKFWYNPMNYTSPWFEGYGDLGQTAIKAAGFAQKDILSEVFIRYPASVTIKHFYTNKEEFINDRLYVILRSLIRGQYQWQLLDENEQAPDGAYIIDIDDGEDFSVESIMSAVKAAIPQSVFVLENGELADELLVRKFTDGSTVILDLSNSDKARELVVCEDGVQTLIMLQGRGHYIFGEALPEENALICKIKPEFSLKLDKNNTMRCNLHEENMEYTFTVQEEVKNITLAVRNYYYDGEITLDGIKLAPYKSCNCLTKGLNELYRCTDSFTLTKGKHTVRTSIAAESELYLPTCFVCGKFAADLTDTISPLPEIVSAEQIGRSVIPQYAGVITLETTVEIPSQPSAIEFDSSELYTRLYINGHYLGAQMSGYKWNIPAEYLGHSAKLRIEQYTTISPVFGRVMEAVSHKSYDPAWLEGKIGRHKCGVSNVKFRKQEFNG